MKLTCPHKTSDSICANCVVQLIEQAVRVEHAKVERLRTELDTMGMAASIMHDYSVIRAVATLLRMRCPRQHGDLVHRERST